MTVSGFRDPCFDDFLRQWTDPLSDFTEARTSGSTGAPKTILLAKSDMRLSARATNRFFGISESSALLMPLSASYIAGKMMIVRAMEAGCRLIVEKASLTPMITGGLPVLDLVPVVPAQLPHLLSDSRRYALAARNYIIGGGAIAPATEQALTEAGFNAFATYGMTETCSHVALRPLGCGHYSAMPGIRFDTDPQGCLTIISDDYSWGRLQTNDAVDLLTDSTFVWRGRRDFVINSGGVKLFAEEIERKLSRVLRGTFYITSTPDALWGEAVTLVYEKSPVVTEDDILVICRAALDRYEVPKHIVFAESIGRTASGKIIRRRPGEISRTC